MLRELRDRWTAALRSGKYQQGTEYLRTEDNKYCCLGVLCELAGFNSTRHQGIGIFEYSSPEANLEENSVGGELDEHMRDFVGLTAGQQSELIDMNDQRGMSFLEIADWIEQHL